MRSKIMPMPMPKLQISQNGGDRTATEIQKEIISLNEQRHEVAVSRELGLTRFISKGSGAYPRDIGYVMEHKTGLLAPLLGFGVQMLEGTLPEGKKGVG